MEPVEKPKSDLLGRGIPAAHFHGLGILASPFEYGHPGA
jgi:hypothetical protein